jgi:hypothetical protein
MATIVPEVRRRAAKLVGLCLMESKTRDVAPAGTTTCDQRGAMTYPHREGCHALLIAMR